MKSRAELIKAGKLHQVYENGAENVLFEGNLTKCRAFVKEKFGWRFYKTGKIRIGQLIWEETN